VFCETGPLLISTDLNVISNASLQILTAKELIAINQVVTFFLSLSCLSFCWFEPPRQSRFSAGCLKPPAVFLSRFF
jgi:hypothetical protein